MAYHLTAAEVMNKVAGRENNFRVDPAITTGSASLADYKGAPYDRGHLAPAGDMAWSSLAMSESFFMSNMIPQLPGFNRGIWKQLEEQVRAWAELGGSLWVVTGPVLGPGLPAIGPNGVSVPSMYYKVLLDDTQQPPEGIGFLLPNAKSSAALSSFMVPIDQVERATGLDFFSALPDSVEDKVEAVIHERAWPMKKLKKSPAASVAKEAVFTQCLGVTKDGNRCKRMTKDASGYCYQHVPPPAAAADDGQCVAKTKDGSRCKRKATKGRYCWQHAK